MASVIWKEWWEWREDVERRLALPRPGYVHKCCFCKEDKAAASVLLTQSGADVLCTECWIGHELELARQIRQGKEQAPQEPRPWKRDRSLRFWYGVMDCGLCALGTTAVYLGLWYCLIPITLLTAFCLLVSESELAYEEGRCHL